MAVLTGERVVLAPATAEHVPVLLRIRRAPEVLARWGDPDGEPDWPFDESDTVCFAVLVADEVCGLVQYGEETDPMYRHASIDIFLDPAVHGRGLGRDAVRTIARHLIDDRGHHRLVIDPAADNEPAIRAYAAVGFRKIGVMRQYERDTDGGGWHDGMLMELLKSELRD